MRGKVLDVLEEIVDTYTNEIDNNDFEFVYDEINRFYDFEITGRFTDLLLDNGINPLKYMDYVPDYFLYRSDIESFIIPDNVIRIGEEAFSGCSNLTNLTIPGGMHSIERNAFLDCDNLIITYDGTPGGWMNISGWADTVQEVVYLRG